MFSVISLLTDEILNEEGLSYADIKRLPQGAYSDVIEIGSKVIKVGGKRFCYDLPNCPYLLQPLIRVNLENISSIRGTLEVEERVEMSSDISTSEVYSLYENLRDKYLKNDQCSWLVKKRNEVLKERPFSLEKKSY